MFLWSDINDLRIHRILSVFRCRVLAARKDKVVQCRSTATFGLNAN